MAHHQMSTGKLTFAQKPAESLSVACYDTACLNRCIARMRNFYIINFGYSRDNSSN